MTNSATGAEGQRGAMRRQAGATEAIGGIPDSIGKELRNLYDDVVAQPVPDRFLKLLNQLETNVLSSSATL